MPTPITPSDVLKQMPQPVTPGVQPAPVEVPTLKPKPIKKAIKNVEPFSFSVPTRTDVGDREEAMQRKASAMNQITGYDVGEFLQKLALDMSNVPDMRNLPDMNMDVNKVKSNLNMANLGGFDANKVKSNLQASQPKFPKLS